MRAELAQAHAALSQVVEAMDDHLFTLRIDARRASRVVYSGPNLEALIGSPAADERGRRRLRRRSSTPTIAPLGRPRWPRLRRGGRCELEYRVVGVDGRERIVSTVCARAATSTGRSTTTA